MVFGEPSVTILKSRNTIAVRSQGSRIGNTRDGFYQGSKIGNMPREFDQGSRIGNIPGGLIRVRGFGIFNGNEIRVRGLGIFRGDLIRVRGLGIFLGGLIRVRRSAERGPGSTPPRILTKNDRFVMTFVNKSYWFLASLLSRF